jgi:hypothetical protein
MDKMERLISHAWLIMDLEYDFINFNFEQLLSHEATETKIVKNNFRHSARLGTDSE